MTGPADKIAAGLEEIGRKASLEAATARRYSDLQGGPEDPTGELWAHVAHLADLVAQLAAWNLDAREAES